MGDIQAHHTGWVIRARPKYAPAKEQNCSFADAILYLVNTGSDVISGDGLRERRWQVNLLADGAELGDAAHEFEELRCPNDRIRNPGSLDQVFLGHFRAEIAAGKKAVSADD